MQSNNLIKPLLRLLYIESGVEPESPEEIFEDAYEQGSSGKDLLQDTLDEQMCFDILGDRDSIENIFKDDTSCTTISDMRTYKLDSNP